MAIAGTFVLLFLIGITVFSTIFSITEVLNISIEWFLWLKSTISLLMYIILSLMWIILIPYYVLRRDRRFLESFPPEAKKEQRILEGKYEMMIVAAVSFLFVGARYIAVSYTHLTLPTNREV